MVVVDLAYFKALAWFFGLFIVAGLGAPFPEEILIVGAGIWAASNPEYGLFRWLMLPVCVVGVLIADALLYGIGRFFGSRLLEYRWVSWIVPPQKRERIEKNFHEFGVGILLFGRLLPGIRMPLFLMSGILRLPVPRFIVADGIGAVLGNSLLFFLAYWFGDQFREFIEQLGRKAVKNEPIVIMGVIALVGIYLLIHFLRKPVTEGDPKELPIIGQTIAVHLSTDEKAEKTGAVEPSANGVTGPKAEVRDVEKT